MKYGINKKYVKRGYKINFETVVQWGLLLNYRKKN